MRDLNAALSASAQGSQTTTTEGASSTLGDGGALQTSCESNGDRHGNAAGAASEEDDVIGVCKIATPLF